jgi:hypothetical protein
MDSVIRIKNIETPVNTHDSKLFIPKIQVSITSYFLVFFAAGVLYILTCAPGPVWQDPGLIQYRIWHNDIEGKLGLALSHPLFYLIAILFKHIPIGDFFYKVNILGTIISAFAISNLYLLLRLWIGENFPSLLGTATLALSHTFWQHSTMPETYGLAVALLLLELIMLLMYARTAHTGYMYLLAFINGLAISNHMLASIAFICYFTLVIILVIKKQLKIRHIFVMMILWLTGAAPYEYLIVKNIIHTHDISGTIISALFGLKWKNAVLNTSLTWTIIKENFLYIALNFPTPNILFFLVGIWSIYKISPKKWFATVLVTMSIMYFIFAFRYTVQDRYAFFIPFYCMVSIFIGIGVFRYLFKGSGLAIYIISAFCLLVVPAYIKGPQIAKRLNFEIGSGRKIPYRNDVTYFLYPWKIKDDSAERFATEALVRVKPPSVIYADGTTAPPLLLMQDVRKLQSGKDIKIISSIGSSQDAPDFNTNTIDDLLSDRNIYVVSEMKGYCPDFLSDRCNFEPEGVLFRAVKKNK